MPPSQTEAADIAAGSGVPADRSLMAHLLRRAGLGVSADELDAWCALGYEAAVETLLNPEPGKPPYGNCADDDLITRVWAWRRVPAVWRMWKGKRGPRCGRPGRLSLLRSFPLGSLILQ